MSATPQQIANAWATWHSRHGGKLGPGPAFVEAINAALDTPPNSHRRPEMTKVTEEMVEAEELWENFQSRRFLHGHRETPKESFLIVSRVALHKESGETLPPVEHVAGGEKPFMYGIMEPDGTAYMDEVCVDLSPGPLEELIEESEMTGYTVVPLYLHPATQIEASGDDLRAACKGIADDYMTSENHHPGYVLIPTAKFEEIRAALEDADSATPSPAQKAEGPALQDEGKGETL